MSTTFSQAVMKKALDLKPWTRKVGPNRYRVTPRTADHGKYELEYSWDADGLPEILSCVDVRTKEPCKGFSFTSNCYHGAALAKHLVDKRERQSQRAA